MIFANIMGFGNPVEIAIIGGIVLLLFGGSKLAGFGKSLGEGLKEFKKATKDLHDGETPPADAPVLASAAAPQTLESPAAAVAPSTKE